MTDIVGWRYELKGAMSRRWVTKLQFDKPDPDDWKEGNEIRNIEPLVPGDDDPVAWRAEYFSLAYNEWREDLFDVDVSGSDRVRGVQPLVVTDA